MENFEFSKKTLNKIHNLNPYERRYKRLDWEFYIKTLFLTVVAILAVIFIVNAVFEIKANYDENRRRLRGAEAINTQMEQVVEIGERMKIETIARERLAERKRKYTIEEEQKIQTNLLKAQSKISNKMIPVGTYLYLINTRQPVKVTGYYGYIAQTKEGIEFDISNEEYTLLSYREYEIISRFKEQDE